jgi:hypothetical protein
VQAPDGERGTFAVVRVVPTAAPSARSALFTHLIDDASLFPPAKLPMRESLVAHRRNRESAYASLAGRYVLPASRSDELLAQREPGVALRLSVILDGAASDDWERGFARDLEAVTDLQAAGLAVESLEVRVPPGEPIDPARLIAAVGTLPAENAPAIWFEVPYDGGWRQGPDEALAALAEVVAASPVPVGAKVRCGGLELRYFPTVEELASFVIGAQAYRVPWKATAGLHHPFRGKNGAFTMHGFLNLFIAAVALHAGAIEAERIAQVIGEPDARAFSVDGAHVAWRDVRVGPDEVAAARDHATSYGSCSFCEPVTDLVRAGLLA